MEPTFILAGISAASVRDRVLIRAAEGASAQMAEPTPDKAGALIDAVRVLDSIGVGYALIGGIAVGIQTGLPRATLDVDLAILSTADRKAVVKALSEAGFRAVGAFAHSLNFRHTTGEPVQLAFDPRFDVMIARAERIVIADQTVKIVSKDDLIEMKRQAAEDPARRRSKALRDQADLALLLGDVPDPDEGW